MISIYFTCPNEKTARKIARALILERLAACVNIVPGIASHFFWKGKMCEDRECLAFVKTRKSLASQAMLRIKALHPYETPAILSLLVANADPDYRTWLFGSTQAAGKKSVKIKSKNSRRQKSGPKIRAHSHRA
ncbi:MAG: divalent-cation tolerance protein CutA [Spirochaetia bacterium]|nr:divalent-cation tolerance protein CutA [Spirochaetia bacterium]